MEESSPGRNKPQLLNPKLYAMAFCIPRLVFHLASRSRNKEKPLTKTEKALRKVLAKSSKKTIIGEGIHIALGKKRNEALRGIISELKDQLRDAPDSLKKVVGEEGFQLLKQL